MRTVEYRLRKVYVVSESGGDPREGGGRDTGRTGARSTRSTDGRMPGVPDFDRDAGELIGAELSLVTAW